MRDAVLLNAGAALAVHEAAYDGSQASLDERLAGRHRAGRPRPSTPARPGTTLDRWVAATAT